MVLTFSMMCISMFENNVDEDEHRCIFVSREDIEETLNYDDIQVTNK